MAYSKRNFLKRVKKVNEVYLEHAKKGMFHRHIYDNFIKDAFNISRSTFYEYLAIPYKTLIRDLDEQERIYKEQNPTLFDDDENINGN